MTAYFVALSLPRDQRAKLIDQTMEYLKDLDNSDSQVQPVVRLMMGKLQLLKGNYEDASKTLQTLIGPDKDVQPAPGAESAVRGPVFFDGRAAQLRKTRRGKEGAQFTDRMGESETAAGRSRRRSWFLRTPRCCGYRIIRAEGAAASDPTTKKADEVEATDVLVKLSQQREDLKPIIYQQLAEQMPKDTPVNAMDPLLLQALMAKAYGESNKPEGQTLDNEALQRGLDAAQEVVNRKNAANIPPKLRDDAAQLIPVLLEAMGKKVDAANAFLAYAQQNATTRTKEATEAINDAGRLTFELRKTSPDDPAVAALYDRFLPVAIAAPFNRTQLAFFYGQRLRLQNKPQEAIKYFQMVPKNDRNYAGAQYYTMQATQDLLDNPKLTETQRAILAADLVRQAEAVRQQYQSARGSGSEGAGGNRDACRSKGHRRRPEKTATGGSASRRIREVHPGNSERKDPRW